MATVAQMEAALRKADAAGDAEAARVIAQAIKSERAKPATFGETAVDMARAVPGGVAKGTMGIVDMAALPTMVTNQGLSVAEQLSGQQIPRMPMPSQFVEDSIGGYYKPQTVGGEYAETAASFLPAAATPGSAITRLVGRVALPAVASETAGQLTKGTPYEPVARVGGALAGGGVGAVTRSIARPFVNATSEAERILTRSARGRGAQVAARAAEHEAADVPYSFLDITPHQTLRTARAAAGGLEGEASDHALSYVERLTANTQSMAGNAARRLTPQAGTVEEIDAGLETAQRAANRTNYGNIGSVRTNTDAISTLTDDYGRQAIAKALAGARANRDAALVAELERLQAAAAPGNAGRFPPRASGLALEEVRKAFNEMGAEFNASPVGRDRFVARGLFDRARSIDRSLEAEPAAAHARGVHADYASRRDALELGQLGARGMSDTDYVSQIGQLASRSPLARESAGAGYARSAEQNIRHPAPGSTGYLNRLRGDEQRSIQTETFGPQQANQFQTQIRLITERLTKARGVSPASGSQTAPRLAEAASLLDPGSAMTVHGLMRVVDAYRRHSVTPAIRAEMVRLATSEADARRLAAMIPRGMTTQSAFARALGQSVASGNAQTTPQNRFQPARP
jgi:hypothetical protein